MFYEPRSGLPAPLTHNPFPALVAPRPIAWITTTGSDGSCNLAPFSHYNIVSVDPPMVMFAPSDKGGLGAPKDTLRNVTEIPEFVVNVATGPMREAINQSSTDFAYGDSELLRCGLHTAPSVHVRAPRILEAPAALECRVFDSVRLPKGKRDRGSTVVIGEVIGIYIEDSMIVHGRIQSQKMAQLSRLGYFDYCVVNEIFEMARPEHPNGS